MINQNAATTIPVISFEPVSLYIAKTIAAVVICIFLLSSLFDQQS